MTIHDHFDGSAHCVECKGFCRLTNEERAVTALIRYVFELYLRKSGPSSLLRSALEELGVPIQAFMERVRRDDRVAR